MKHALSLAILALAASILLTVFVGATLFRYELRGNGSVRYDRWTGSFQQINEKGEWKN